MSEELVKANGVDGHEYSVRPIEWHLDDVEKCGAIISKFSIFSDEVPKNPEGFLSVVLGMQAIWYEIFDLTLSERVGLMYLTDISKGADRSVSVATWHAMLWDAKAGPRRPVLKAAVRALFDRFGFHRLQAEIPCKHGGVIRAARKIGFIVEGRLRQNRRYDGVWYDSVVLGLLEHEVAE